MSIFTGHDDVDSLNRKLVELIDERIEAAHLKEEVRLDPSQFNSLLAALKGPTPPASKPHLTFSITTPCGVKITGVPPLMLTLKDNQSVTYTIGGTDSKGNPATITGPVTWALSDSTTLSVTPAADGMSAVVAALGPLSTAAGVQLTVTDTGDGGLTGTDTIVVVGSSPTTLVLTPGAPTP
jgi:hypothetical protein